jgi:hypothetical protein
MGKLINDLLSTPIPAEVWHYTNLVGFEGILRSGRVWATEAHHTTDKTEFIHSRDVAAQYLKRWLPEDKSMVWAKQTAQETLSRAFEDGALAPSHAEIFVASFCGTDDLKSQWMEYGDAGRGVALSFDLRRIRPPDELGSSVTFAPCLYVKDDKERVIEDALSDWVNTAFELHKKTGSQEWAAERLRDWRMIDKIFGLPFDKAALVESNKKEFGVQLHQSLTQTSFDLLRIASHCKDYTFHQECEWRLALPHTKGKPMKYTEILHRGTNGAIPYVAHNLFSDRLPLVRLKTGPVCENTDQIKGLLKQYGYDVPVEHSAIPIRLAASIQQ